MTASDHSKKRGHCDPSTPNSSQITCRGNGIESDSTTSNAAPLWIGEISADAFAVTPASISRTIDGLKPGCTRRRYRVCCGGSVCIMVGGLGYSAPISMTRMPFPELNVSGSRETAVTSAWRLTNHRPWVSLRATGASARSRA